MQADLRFYCSHRAKTGFLMTRLNYVAGTHWNHLAEVILMSTHNICFYGEIRKIIHKLSHIPTLSVLFVNTFATSCQNLIMPYANNKGTDQPGHLHSLISTFFTRCQDSIIPIIIPKLAMSFTAVVHQTFT